MQTNTLPAQEVGSFSTLTSSHDYHLMASVLGKGVASMVVSSTWCLDVGAAHDVVVVCVLRCATVSAGESEMERAGF
jgi:hypothetical protein